MDTARLVLLAEFFLLIAIIAIIAWLAASFIYQRWTVSQYKRVVANRYELLDFLNGKEWKSIVQMADEIKRAKKVKSVNISLICIDLNLLEEEVLLMSRASSRMKSAVEIPEYQLSHYGVTKKNRRHNVSPAPAARNGAHPVLRSI